MMTGGVKCQLLIFSSAGLYVFNLWLLWDDNRCHLFYFQDSVLWPTIHEVPIWKMLLVMVIGFTLIPVSVLDIRGWTEMHPLNGPGWLFYEYIGNILYALFVEIFKTALSILVFLSAALII
jgi:hypothetical protein